MNNISELVFWLIPGLPLAAFVVVFIGLRTLRASAGFGALVSIGATIASFGLSLWTCIKMFYKPEIHLLDGFTWFSPGNTITADVGFLINPLTAIMLVVVSTISLLVQIYSIGYMRGDGGLNRYFSFISLFTFAMLSLVMSDNLLVMFMSWELVGLCSYLLIGFWFHRPEAANAAKKAFFITRIGDFGFLAAILVLFNAAGTFDIQGIHQAAAAGIISGSAITWAALGIFFGAMGKSAQFPLHTWLPDAMEGPTPVSALIHAATMVAAGVFLVARMYPLFELSEAALTVVSIVGGITALLAATIALVMWDIKRVLAYSTISQLGYMMAGIGLGGPAIAIFHLFTHAFFKALLFMGAGSVSHSTGTFDMRKMGGLSRYMPWTCVTFVIGALSLSGIWPLAGFFSKEAILANAANNQPVLFAILLLTVLLTAFYMFRVVFTTFGGRYNGQGKPHESPMVMLLPMIALAILAISSGWLNATGTIDSLLGDGIEQSWITGIFGVFSHLLTWVSLMLVAGGIFLAWTIYSKKWFSADRISTRFAPAYALLANKYWFDEFYNDIIGGTILNKGLFGAFEKLDNLIIDKAVNGTATLIHNTSALLRKAQNGKLQTYLFFFTAGLALILFLVIIIR
ncbi:MAG: NADH-quinone oxidoreductase subunit L [Dehalococcoidales bacterium]|nr:NADH-quinone oxidoreductase subunit L [Dehalococcoidales bacterium]